MLPPWGKGLAMASMSFLCKLRGRKVHCGRRHETCVDKKRPEAIHWIYQTLQHYRTKQESLWTKARKEGREGVKK